MKRAWIIFLSFFLSLQFQMLYIGCYILNGHNQNSVICSFLQPTDSLFVMQGKHFREVLDKYFYICSSIYSACGETLGLVLELRP